MACIHFYVASCALLLTLSWRTSTGLPVPTPSAENQKCPSLFKKLLLDITEALNSEDLCYSIQSDKVEMGSTAETVVACAPTLTQNPGCMMQRNSSFSENECLRNIMKDLAYYDDVIQSYLTTNLRSETENDLLRPLSGIIQNLRENCFPNLDEESDSSEKRAPKTWDRDNSFGNRLEMCKMMRGFRIRAITINRAMGYISSGDHRK